MGGMEHRVHEEVKKPVGLGKDVDEQVPGEVGPQMVQGGELGLERGAQLGQQVVRVCAAPGGVGF